MSNSEFYKKRESYHGSQKPKECYSNSLIQVIESSGNKFGRLFPDLPCATEFSQENALLMRQLGLQMADMLTSNRDNVNVPAGYTFLGQFIDHDITLDITDIFDLPKKPEDILNFRTPLLDLDNVYGRGPAVDPFLYDQSGGADQGIKLLIGQNQKVDPSLPIDFDLPRNSQGTAIIGDPRNNENVIVAQIQLAFLKFHNAIVDHLRATGSFDDKNKLFAEAQRLARWHYQFMVIHDFAKTIVGAQKIDKILAEGNKIFDPNNIFMPVEFSGAAYRFGHSMVRNGYLLNSNVGTPLIQLFELTAAPLPNTHIIGWNHFFPKSAEVSGNPARKTDTHLSQGLFNLPGEVPENRPDLLKGVVKELSGRNLIRGLGLCLPSGQAVAKHLGFTPLTSAEILQNASTPERLLLEQGNNGELLENTPLWYYILKEAEVKQGGAVLGDVGGTIVGEVLVGLVIGNPNSYYNNKKSGKNWKPELPGAKEQGKYTMADILEFAGMYNIPGIS